MRCHWKIPDVLLVPLGLLCATSHRASLCLFQLERFKWNNKWCGVEKELYPAHLTQWEPSSVARNKFIVSEWQYRKIVLVWIQYMVTWKMNSYSATSTNSKASGWVFLRATLFSLFKSDLNVCRRLCHHSVLLPQLDLFLSSLFYAHLLLVSGNKTKTSLSYPPYRHELTNVRVAWYICACAYLRLYLSIYLHSLQWTGRYYLLPQLVSLLNQQYSCMLYKCLPS